MERRIPEKNFKEIDIEVKDTKYNQLKGLKLEMKNLAEEVKLLVLGKENGDYEYLVTNDSYLEALEVLRVWKDRWSIETVHKDCKQELGLGVYQSRDMSRIVIHLPLVFLAYGLLKAFASNSSNCLSSVSSCIGEICRFLKFRTLENFVEDCIRFYEKNGKISKVRKMIRSNYPI